MLPKIDIDIFFYLLASILLTDHYIEQPVQYATMLTSETTIYSTNQRALHLDHKIAIEMQTFETNDVYNNKL